jgi:16S rRNA (guanine527-N7)-methyltransferase
MTTNTKWQTLVREEEFNSLLMEWNTKINLVSRKKTSVLDLIADSRLFFGEIDFRDGINILDLGTGGGFPGIVIAIHHPEANLVLVDSIQKKINVVSDIIKKMNLTSCTAICSRAEDLTSLKSPFEKGDKGGFEVENVSTFENHFDYVVSRSVAVLQDLCLWSKDLIKPRGKLITVKGGDIAGEIHKTRKLNYIRKVKTTIDGERKIVAVDFI